MAGTRSTPVRITNASEDEESPYFPCSTQENEDVDVLWDWNSPQSKPSKPIVRRSRKKLNLQSSPKVPWKRHNSNNDQIRQDFNKLREELRSLKEEIAKPDNEASLVLSPNEEETFKNDHDIDPVENFSAIERMIEENQPEHCSTEIEDVFDDSMEEQMILFSQQVEKELESCQKSVNVNSKVIGSKIVAGTSSECSSNMFQTRSCSPEIQQPKKKLTVFTFKSKPNLCYNNNFGVENPYNQSKTSQNQQFSNNLISSVIPNSKANNSHILPNSKTNTVTAIQDSEDFNDSFDNVLSQMNTEVFEELTQVVNIKQYKNGNSENDVDKKSKVFSRSHSADYTSCTQKLQVTSGKVEWHRTQSFENYSDTLPKDKLEEIERRRLEAKAKRDANMKKQGFVIPTIAEAESDFAFKCSPEEIEKKRLQARAKLEAKRQQEIIEKKRLEALKRREEKKKLSGSVPNSQYKRP